jgi:hypothetical protein
LAAVLVIGFGVDRVAGLRGPVLEEFVAAEDDAVELEGMDIEGLEPERVDSEGFRVQENMSAPGMVQPLLQPD